MLIRSLVALLFVFSSRTVSAQSVSEALIEEKISAGIEFVYNLEFENADRQFQEVVTLRPQHPAGHFFLAMVQWWRILIDIENEKDDDKFYDMLEHVIDLCDDMLDKNKNDVTAMFFKGGSIGFRGRLRAHRSEWFGAANDGRRALPLVQHASQFDPNNYDIQLGTGIYNYYAEVIPDEYPFVKPLLLFVPPGDRKKGIQQLTIAAEKGKYASIESKYFLMQLYYLHEKEYQKALAIAIELNTRFPNNMLFHRYLGRCYVVLNEWPRAEEVFREVAARVKRGQRGYTLNIEREAVYYLGMNQMQKSSFDAALDFFYRADELSRKIDNDGPSGFQVMLNLKVGQIYDLQGKRPLAIGQYKKVLDMKDYRESHKQARQFLKSPYSL